MEKLYRIITNYGACAGVIVGEDNIVIDTAPIFRWMIGKKFENIKRWKKIKEIKGEANG